MEHRWFIGTGNPKQNPAYDLEPIYNRFIQLKKEVKVDDLHRETKETRREIGTLKQNLCGLQKTQSLESTSSSHALVVYSVYQGYLTGSLHHEGSVGLDI